MIPPHKLFTITSEKRGRNETHSPNVRKKKGIKKIPSVPRGQNQMNQIHVRTCPTSPNCPNVQPFNVLNVPPAYKPGRMVG